MNNAPEQVFVVSHTHWDREWYLTASEFMVDLTRVFGGVLDALETPDEENGFEHFVMDGQAIALEDHVSYRPDDAARIEALCRTGKLSLGPWYILPDEFLVSGEAMARNLLIGHQVCARFGGAQKVGYMPDSFGHLAQIPQLLRLAGIDSFIYTRGNGDEIEELGHEYLWEAPDGSEVLAINQCGGYCNGGGLGFQEIWHAHTRREVSLERAVEQMTELFEKMVPLSRTPIRLLNNGCDHFPVQQDFARVMSPLREAFPGTQFRHTDFAAYLAALRDSGFEGKRFRGELLGGKQHHILSGVWSARMPIKQANDDCQHWLARVAEPACAAFRYLDGQPYPTGTLNEAWKKLLSNHPHDSICGCSTDEVHAEMMPRFAGVRETAERLVSRGLNDVAPRFASRAELDLDTVITVLNPLPVRRSEIIERLIILQPPGQDTDRLRLFDDEGRQVPFHIVEKQYVERFWGIDYRAQLDAESQLARFDVYREKFADRILRPAAEADTADCFLRIQFEASDLPALGRAGYHLRECDEAPAAMTLPPVKVEDAILDNGLLRVTLREDGRFDLEDLVGGRNFPSLHLLADDEDAGDEYDHSHAENRLTLTSSGLKGEIRCLESSPYRAVLECTLKLPLPTALRADRRGREETRIDCPLRVRVSLTAGSPLLDVETLFDNRAEDHRLRVEFPTSIDTDRVLSDGHYLVVDRPLAPPTGEDWVQPHPGTYPQQDYSLLQDDEGGLALLSRGLPEIMPMRGESGAGISLTLLRAVGWLSRDDFESRRRCNAGPTLFTPDAQCLGEQRFRYALLPFRGDHLSADVKGASERWRTAPPTSQGVADGLLPAGRGLLENREPSICVSAIKRADNRDALIVRLYNLSGEEKAARLRPGLELEELWRCDLIEEREEKLPLGGHLIDGELRVPLRGHGILTLELNFREAKKTR